MSQASAPLETTQGYATPCVRQFSVFLENKVGRLLELVESFNDERACQLCAINVHEASDHAVVRLLPNASGIARDLLKRHEYPFAEKDLIVVELTPGALYRYFASKDEVMEAVFDGGGALDARLLAIANTRMSEVMKAKGYPYQFVFAEAAGHVDQRVQLQTMAEAFEWVWKGYKPSGK
jgi:hypothetical protein